MSSTYEQEASVEEVSTDLGCIADRERVPALRRILERMMLLDIGLLPPAMLPVAITTSRLG